MDRRYKQNVKSVMPLHRYIENVVTKDFRCWPNALVCLYGLMYSLQHGYPNCTKNTFGFIQKVLLNLDGDRINCKIPIPKTFMALNNCK
uniref:Uncharacterized protein n=1 Tax=Oncorhynchus mykiss TaxID=8022 RepID=A0A8K9WW38_ONCMY